MRQPALRTIALFIFSVCLLPVGSGLVHAQGSADDTKVGVTVSAVINAQPHVGPRVSAALGKVLGTVLKADVLAGPDAQARLPEEARSETCLGESTCLVNAGKALGVDQLLMLIIVGVGDELKIEATWVDVATGETALRPGITSADTEDAMQAAFSARAQELLPGVSARDSATVTTPVTPVGTTPIVTEPTGKLVATNTPPPKSSNALAIGLTAGGAVILAGWGAYGISKLGTCDDLSCDPEDATSGRDLAVDVIAGGLGTLAFSAGIYMLLTSNSGSEGQPSPAPVSVLVDSESLGFSYGGRF